LLKFFENNHKCVPFGLFITNINLLLLFIFSCTIHRNTTNSFIPVGSNIQFSTNTEKEQVIIKKNLYIVELDRSGNYRDKTSHNEKKYFIWYIDILMKNLLNFENELIEYRKS
jgi:hypothetical protein